ncbi:hypothetical protein NC77_02435 [Janthinobacterium lividum]|nr:hypothetical protein NC77_02435 [Janthinobacterium lividum]
MIVFTNDAVISKEALEYKWIVIRLTDKSQNGQAFRIDDGCICFEMFTEFTLDALQIVLEFRWLFDPFICIASTIQASFDNDRHRFIVCLKNKHTTSTRIVVTCQDQNIVNAVLFSNDEVADTRAVCSPLAKPDLKVFNDIFKRE